MFLIGSPNIDVLCEIQVPYHTKDKAISEHLGALFPNVRLIDNLQFSSLKP
jgi:hypothetical protein